jgi:hypothetical protein
MLVKTCDRRDLFAGQCHLTHFRVKVSYNIYTKTEKGTVMEKLERYIGCLMGLAVGDALGTTLEFQPPGSFDPISDILG